MIPKTDSCYSNYQAPFIHFQMRVQSIGPSWRTQLTFPSKDPAGSNACQTARKQTCWGKVIPTVGHLKHWSPWITASLSSPSHRVSTLSQNNDSGSQNKKTTETTTHPATAGSGLSFQKHGSASGQNKAELVSGSQQIPAHYLQVPMILRDGPALRALLSWLHHAPPTTSLFCSLLISHQPPAYLMI